MDHIKQNDGAVGGDPRTTTYTYNAKAGCSVVDGGFVDNSITRYNKESQVITTFTWASPVRAYLP